MKINIAILSPIEVEYKAVRNYLQHIERQDVNGLLYEAGDYQGTHHSYRVIIRQTGPKNTDIALATEKVINGFKPDIILLVGIAGGVKDVTTGDVVVGTKAYGFDAGKVLDDHLAARPDTIYYDAELIEQARYMIHQDNWTQMIANWNGLNKVIFGPIASSDKVIASTKSPEYAVLKRNFNDTTALEMESIGFAKAAFAHREVRMMNIRGISDLLDGKSDSAHKLAAAQAAAFAFGLLHHLDYSTLKIYAMDAKELIQKALDLIFPLLKNEAKSIPGFLETVDATSLKLWNKIKPLIANEIEELQEAPEDVEVQEEVKITSRKKLRKALESNELLKQDLEYLLKEAEAKRGDSSTNIINSKNIITGGNYTVSGDFHLGDRN